MRRFLHIALIFFFLKTFHRHNFTIVIAATADLRAARQNESSTFNTTNNSVVQKSQQQPLFILSPSSYSFNNRCKLDSHCSTDSSFCVNGSCVKLCNYSLLNNSPPSALDSTADCVYYHCDGKMTIMSMDEEASLQPPTAAADNSGGNRSALLNAYLNRLKRLKLTHHSIIETNNYPNLSHYLKNRKCSWILKNLNYDSAQKSSSEGEHTAADLLSATSSIELKVKRFATQLLNDYLYIFSGDSVFSQLIAALSGPQMSYYDPSSLADSINNQAATKDLNLTFSNVSSLYLLFKTDVLPAKSTFIKHIAFDSDIKPAGISIKHKFSLPCNENTSSRPCPKIKNEEAAESSTKNHWPELIETLKSTERNNNNNNNGFLNSTLRRAHHCSFVYKNYFYVVGGYSFTHGSLSFLSRLDLSSLIWEHNLDRRPNAAGATANTGATKLPSHRYAHACVLDQENHVFYMYGGMKLVNDYENYDHFIDLNKKTRAKAQISKLITSELWSYSFKTNAWTLINQDLIRPSGADASVAQTQQKKKGGEDSGNGRFYGGSKDLRQLKGPKQYALPIAAAGSCMCLIRTAAAGNDSALTSSLLIFSGYSEYYGTTLNLAQEFNFATKHWYLHSIFSMNVKLGFGLSCVTQATSKNNQATTIYLYGGLVVENTKNDDMKFDSFLNGYTSPLTYYKNSQRFYSSPTYFLPKNTLPTQLPYVSDTLYAYELKTNEWHSLSSSSRPCYLHSSVYHEDLIILFGGICQNDDEEAAAAASPFISNELLIYNTTQMKWLFRADEDEKKFYEDDDNDYSPFGIFNINYKKIFEKMVLKNAAATKNYSNSKNALKSAESAENSSKTVVDFVRLFEIKLSNRQRFAHSTFLHNNALHVFAGYNGFFLEDLFRLNLTLAKELITHFNQTNSNCSAMAEQSNNVMFCRQEPLIRINRRRRKRQRANEQPSSSDPLLLLQQPNLKVSSPSSSSSESNKTINDSSSSSSSSSSTQYEPSKAYLDMIEKQQRLHHLSQMVWNTIEFCSLHSSCETCQSYVNCVWNHRKCEYYSLSHSSDNFNGLEIDANNQTVIYKKPTCSSLCSEFKSCNNCTAFIDSYNHDTHLSNCVWCATQSKCVNRKAVNVFYAFGECLQFVEENSQCFERSYSSSIQQPLLPLTTIIENNSSPIFISTHLGNGNDHLIHSPQHFITTGFINLNHESAGICGSYYSNCSSCIRDENCGWCSKDVLFPTLISSSAVNVDDEKSWREWLRNQSTTLNTGYGICMEGSQSGSLYNRCNQNWFFSNCPSCECNGHSTCNLRIVNDQESKSTISCGPCLNNTEGEHCSQCKAGFYGNARNNGACLPCNCTNAENRCDASSGRCYCLTKGVTGSKCDQCESPRYSGRPTAPDGTCYYNLSTDYQFTFNLNKDSDRHFTRINFVNHPTYGSDDDINFTIRCIRSDAMVNITFVAPYNMYENEAQPASSANSDDSLFYNGYDSIFGFHNPNMPNVGLNSKKQNGANKSNETTPNNGAAYYPPPYYSSSYAFPGLMNAGVYNYYFGPMFEQQTVLAQINCSNNEFKYTFYNRDFNYGDKDRNATFVVYVYDFTTPITIQISFSRHSRFQLLHFFVTFFGCLLSLLAVAFIMWKGKQRYDRYRRQRQIVMQMEYMSSRPFTRLLVDVSADDNGVKLINSAANNNLDQSSKQYNQQLQQQPEITLQPMPLSKKQSGGIGGGASSSRLKGLRLNKSSNNTALSTSMSPQQSSSQFQQQRIMPVGVEPLSNNKAAVLTCLLKLPQGDLQHTPKGASPLVLASTFVQINPNSSSFLTTPNNLLSSPDNLYLTDEQANENKTAKNNENT